MKSYKNLAKCLLAILVFTPVNKAQTSVKALSSAISLTSLIQKTTDRPLYYTRLITRDDLEGRTLRELSLM